MSPSMLPEIPTSWALFWLLIPHETEPLHLSLHAMLPEILNFLVFFCYSIPVQRAQVSDLSQEDPLEVLYRFRNVPNLRLLACGGDGTVAWLLQVHLSSHLFQKSCIRAWSARGGLPNSWPPNSSRVPHWCLSPHSELIAHVYGVFGVCRRCCAISKPSALRHAALAFRCS